MAFSDYYDGSFDSVGFLEEYNSNFSPPEPDSMLDYTARHVSGGNKTIVQTTGQVEKEFVLPISCLEAQRNSLRSKIGQKKTLIYHEGTVNNVVLLGLRNQRRATSQIGEEIYKLDLVLIET